MKISHVRSLVLAALMALPATALAGPGGHHGRGWHDPTEAPPALREEQPKSRRGMVWVAGEWTWTGSKWAWTPGHLVAVKRGKRWHAAEWQSQNGVFVRVGGTWDSIPDEPDQDPPAPRDEPAGRRPRRGMVWVAGNWEWKNYQWTWTAGHWEKEHHGQHPVGAHWEHQGDKWVHIGFRWDAD